MQWKCMLPPVLSISRVYKCLSLLVSVWAGAASVFAAYHGYCKVPTEEAFASVSTSKVACAETSAVPHAAIAVNSYSRRRR